MSTFSRDIRAFARRTNSTLSEASRAVKLSLFNGVIRDTRVDTGRMRGNWQTSTGQPIYAEIDRLDPTGAQATAEVEQRVGAFTDDYISNNVPYVKVWEREDGMVRRNLARVERILRDAANG